MLKNIYTNDLLYTGFIQLWMFESNFQVHIYVNEYEK